MILFWLEFMDSLMKQHHSLHDISILNKSSLWLQTINQQPHPNCQDISYYFMTNIQQADWHVLVESK